MEGLVMDSTFWKGKKVFITGHTGFKGSWLSIWLHSMGAEVTGYALNPPTDPSLYELCRIDQLVNSVIADVRDGERLGKAMQMASPEVIIHMAAQPLVRESYKNPVDTYATNVMGTVNLLEAVRKYDSVKAVVNVTTDKCYDNKEWVWGYRENEPLGGYDPYSSSKACSELVTSAYRTSFFNPKDYAIHKVSLASARAGNVIGGGDWAADRLIPDCIRAILNGEKIIIRNPNAIRPWQHVLEPLSCYLILAQKLWQEGADYAEGWNFGPNDEDAKHVSWIVDRLAKTWSEGASWVVDGGVHPHEATYLKLDCSKAHARLGWQPRWDIGQAIEKIVEWQKACDQGADMRKLTLAQINAYQNT